MAETSSRPASIPPDAPSLNLAASRDRDLRQLWTVVFADCLLIHEFLISERSWPLALLAPLLGVTAWCVGRRYGVVVGTRRALKSRFACRGTPLDWPRRPARS